MFILTIRNKITAPAQRHRNESPDRDSVRKCDSRLADGECMDMMAEAFMALVGGQHHHSPDIMGYPRKSAPLA